MLTGKRHGDSQAQIKKSSRILPLQRGASETLPSSVILGEQTSEVAVEKLQHSQLLAARKTATNRWYTDGSVWSRQQLVVAEVRAALSRNSGNHATGGPCLRARSG